jgi:hypothetical protein
LSLGFRKIEDVAGGERLSEHFVQTFIGSSSEAAAVKTICR